MRELLRARRQLRPGLELFRRGRRRPLPQRLWEPSVRPRDDVRERGHERVCGVERCRSEHAGVHVGRPGPDLDVEVEHAAYAHIERGLPASNHSAVEDQRRVRPALILLEPFHDRIAADLLLAVEAEANVDR